MSIGRRADPPDERIDGRRSRARHLAQLTLLLLLKVGHTNDVALGLHARRPHTPRGRTHCSIRQRRVSERAIGGRGGGTPRRPSAGTPTLADYPIMGCWSSTGAATSHYCFSGTSSRRSGLGRISSNEGGAPTWRPLVETRMSGATPPVEPPCRGSHAPERRARPSGS
jgi:hypothetical protein